MFVKQWGIYLLILEFIGLVVVRGDLICKSRVTVFFFLLFFLDDFKFSPVIVDELKKDKVIKLRCGTVEVRLAQAR